MSQRLQAARRTALLAASILLSVGGFGGFVYLFARDFNVFWLILAPIIIALYQIPAVFVFWLYRKQAPQRQGKRGAAAASLGTDAGDEAEKLQAGPPPPQGHRP
jgi:hypothetical protein